MVAEELVATRDALKRLPFHRLTVKELVEETSDVITVVFGVPKNLEKTFSYRAGQYVTLRLQVNGREEFRPYSMSSAPQIDRDLQVTVKRVADGLVSNWLHDNLRVGDCIDVGTAVGCFLLPEGDDSTGVIAFAAGSGITPIISIIKYALRFSDRSIRLLYASPDWSSVIFHQHLLALEEQYPNRLHVTYNVDEAHGLVDAGLVSGFIGSGLKSRFYICGPKGFMDVVRSALVWCGARSHQLHQESFTPTDDVPSSAKSSGALVTVKSPDRTVTITYGQEWTLLQAVRKAGLTPPSSCHLGQCGTCLALITNGRAVMANNQVLSPQEVAEGWILTCQARPVTPQLTVVYES
jgi:ferredoxin-NADP reductase